MQTSTEPMAGPGQTDPCDPVEILSTYVRRGAGAEFHQGSELPTVIDATLETHADFLASMSHQLRTPLTVILGLALTLEQHKDRFPAELVGEVSERIVRNARRLERLVVDILDVDRLTRNGHTLSPAPVHLLSLARDVAGYTDLLDRHPLTVSADDVVVVADRGKVERMLESLFANVTRHTPPGTPVWITAGRRGGEAVLTVEDAGPGFPDDLRARLCEPFVARSPAHDPGAGLGLALVEGFARLHGGGVRLGSGRGGGASVRIYLPVGGPQDEPCSHRIAPGAGSVEGGER